VPPALVGEARPAVAVGGDGEVVVVADDAPGLLATAAGVLAVHGLAILAVDAATADDGVAVQRWRVEEAFGRPLDQDKLRADLDAALGGRFPLAERLEARTRAYRRRTVPVAAPDVLVDDAMATGRATLVEVRAADAVGLLHRLAAALAGAGLDVRSARVQTLGHEAVDAFYVQPRGDAAPDWDAVRAALLAAAG
jgi:[protein-PII] uridylyltransferase